MPTITRTFVMADLAGSSQLWNRYPEQMASALARHDELARRAVGDDGEIFKHTGDGFIAAFEASEQAVRTMVAYQDSLADSAIHDPVELRSRVCVHHGPAEHRAGDWFGPTINHLARLLDLVAPTHVVVSSAAADDLADPLLVLEPLGTFAVRDVPDPVALFDVPLPRAVGPPLTSVAGRGLPQYRSAFVGRAEERGTLGTQLDRSRIVTVVGFGGMGKTRLAIEAAGEWSETRGVPVHFADLVSIPDPLTAIAEAVGVPVGTIDPGVTTATMVARHLGRRPALVVLDNCEHVIEEAADAVGTLLDACTDLRVLATSREPLELDGEVVHALSVLTEDAAMELFRARVEAAGAPSVPEEVARRLCAQVDHLPLGIELVVGRLRHVDARELSDALDRDLDELRSRRRGRASGGPRGGRHATMRALVAWSYDLLGSEQQVLLCRLAQLPAPWPRQVAVALGGDAGGVALDELVAKSFVAVRGGRLRMLEPVRRFALDSLRADPEATDAARRALVSWALGFVADRPDRRPPVFDLQLEHELAEQGPNLQAAIAVAQVLGAPVDEADIVLGLWPLMVDGQARSWFGGHIADALERTPDREQRLALVELALLVALSSPADTGRTEYLRGILVRDDPDRTAPAWLLLRCIQALRDLVIARILGTDPGPARVELAACAESARSDERPLEEAIALSFSAYSFLLHRELDAAASVSEQAARVVRRVRFGPLAAMADALTATARCLHDADDDHDVALDIIGAARALSDGTQWDSAVSATHVHLLARAGRLDEAREATVHVVELALARPLPPVRFDGAIALAAYRAGTGDRAGAVEALDLAGIGRTPLTLFLLFELASDLGFDLGVDRFAEILDPAAERRRSDRAAALLRLVLAELVHG